MKIKCLKDSEIFEWNEHHYISKDCTVTDQFIAGAETISAPCPKCGTDNILYVKCPPTGADPISEIAKLLRLSSRGVIPKNRITTEDDPFDMY